jgi:hypothetical protein
MYENIIAAILLFFIIYAYIVIVGQEIMEIIDGKTRL